MNGMNSHSNGDAAWNREMRERKALENAAYRKGQMDMRERAATALLYSTGGTYLVTSLEIKDYGC